MERPEAHQIDELAQRVFRSALPPTWVVNEQYNDYGKDYLVEIAAADGRLTGDSFFVQLKGQRNVSVNAGGAVVKFPLKSKHAEYYCDQVRDVPVFLVLVDVSRNKGWWLFLQGALRSDASWRYRDSRTLRIPTENELSKTAELRLTVAGSKDWMRRNYPDFRTPFLQQCFDFMSMEMDLAEARRSDDGMVEQLNTSYFPDLPNGIPSFDSHSNNWEFYGGSDDEPANLMLDVCSDGTFMVSAGDDDGVFLDVPLRNPEEIGEVLFLAETLDEQSAIDASHSLLTISSVIDSLELIVPSYERYALISVSDVMSISDDAEAIVDALMDNDSQDSWDYLVNIGFGGWDQWCHEQNRRLAECKLRQPDSRTLVFSHQTGLTSFRRWLAFDDHRRVFSIPVALSRRPDSCAPMFLCDIANDTDEGRSILRQVIRDWKTYPGDSAEIEFSAPATILGQVRSSVEKRMTVRSKRY